MTHTATARHCLALVLIALAAALAGCRTAGPARSDQPAVATATSDQATAATNAPLANKPLPKRLTYTPRPYPVDERGFSPVDKALAKAYAREELVEDDAEGALNPYVMKVISGYPLDGSYPYHCSWTPREYDIYNGVTQDLWYKGLVVAKAYPDGSRCSYCCGFTFEVFVRAMKLRNIQKGLDPDDFNGMTFGDLFNLLQLWYIEGKGDSEQRGIVAYGLGRAITNLEDAHPGDFLSYSTTPPGGHSVIFIDWIRETPPANSGNGGSSSNSNSNDGNGGNSSSPPLNEGGPGGGSAKGKIIGLKYFSSNLSGSHGVGYGQGKFSDSNNGRGLLRNSVKIGRVGSIQDYKPFDRLQIPQRNAYAPTQPDRLLYLPPQTQPAS